MVLLPTANAPASALTLTIPLSSDSTKHVKYCPSFSSPALAFSPDSAFSSHSAVLNPRSFEPASSPLALHIELLHPPYLHLVRHELHRVSRLDVSGQSLTGSAACTPTKTSPLFADRYFARQRICLQSSFPAKSLIHCYPALLTPRDRILRQRWPLLLPSPSRSALHIVLGGEDRD